MKVHARFCTRIELRSIRCKERILEKILRKKACQMFLVQVDLCKFLVQVSWTSVSDVTLADLLWMIVACT